jgi:diguanylate cyclase (GGDEF)-like protein/PAS domain S-box-containing protein
MSWRFRLRFPDIVPVVRNAIIECMRDTVMVFDAQDRLIDLNPAAQRLTGLTVSQAVGQPANSILSAWPDLIERYCTLQETQGELVSCEAPDERCFDFQLSSLNDHQGEPIGRLLVLRDVTGYKKAEAAFRQAHDELEARVEQRTMELANADEKLIAEIAGREELAEALHLTEAKYRTLVEQITAVTYIDAVDETSSSIFMSPQIERLSGYSPLEWLADPGIWPKLLHPEDRERVLAEHHRTNATGDPFKVEYRMVTRDNRIVWVRDEALLLRDEAGLPLYWQGVMLDITALEQVDEALRLSEAKYRLLVDEVNDGFYICDMNGVLTYANRALARILGYEKPEALIGINFLQFVQSVQADEIAGQFRTAMATGTGSQVVEVEIIRQDGSTGFVEINPQIIYEAGRPVGNRGRLRDITEARREQALREAVYRIANATETTRSLNDLFPQIHQIISSVMPAENFYITLYDEAHDVLRFPYFQDSFDDPYIDQLSPGKGLTAYVLRTGKSLLCTQAVHDELERQGEVILVGVPSKIWLGVPLMIEGKTIGVMVVQHYTDPNAYGEREQHMLEFVSSQVAIAITRKQAEEALKRSQERYRDLFEHSPISLWEEDFSAVKLHLEALQEQGIKGFRLYLQSHPELVDECAALVANVEVNKAALELFRADRKEVLLANLADILMDESREIFIDQLVNIAQGKTKFSWQGVIRNLAGEQIDVSLTWSAAPGHEDDLSKVIVSLLDITELKRAEEALRNISLVDDLTGLYNRRGFFTLAEQQLKLASRMDKVMLLLYCDLDHLKRINDTLGHPSGDQALIEVAVVFRETFREADILARLGGDEFVVLAIESTEVSASALAARLQATLETHNQQPGRSYQLSLSLGIARYDPGSPLSVADLITQADRLMYLQKQAKN